MLYAYFDFNVYFFIIINGFFHNYSLIVNGFYESEYSNCNIRAREAEAVVQRCSVKTVFLELLQNSQKNTYMTENTRKRVRDIIRHTILTGASLKSK